MCAELTDMGSVAKNDAYCARSTDSRMVGEREECRRREESHSSFPLLGYRPFPSQYNQFDLQKGRKVMPGV